MNSSFPSSITLSGIEILLPPPFAIENEWIGESDSMNQLLAAWTKIDEFDLPMNARLLGNPGTGKTSLAIACAQKMDLPIWLFQCTSDTRPEDLIITPVLNQEGKISYRASGIFAATILGGVAILDEGNRMSEKSWASLTALLDHRRTLESIVAGIQIQAHPEFRCCTTMNEDSSTFDIPEYILSRLQPTIKIPYPNYDEELAILQYHLPSTPIELLGECARFLATAHDLDLSYSVRDGLNVCRYAHKLAQTEQKGALAKDYFVRSLQQILGDEATNLPALAASRAKWQNYLEQKSSLEDYFDDEDPRH